jgi:hypothetical protein
MSRTTVLVDGAPVIVSQDVGLAGPDALWTVATVRIIDEITQRLPDRVLSASVEEPPLTTRLGEDGRVGVLVQPWPQFPLTSSPGFSAHVNLAVAGFLPRRLVLPIVRTLTVPAVAGDTVLNLDTVAGMRPQETWTIGDPAVTSEPIAISALGPGAAQVTLGAPLGSGYGLGLPVAPGPLTILDFGDAELHRRAVLLRGRVMEFVPATQTWQPPAAATLDITHVWRRQADVTNDLAKETLRMVSIAPGLYTDRRALADVLQPIDVNNVAGDEKTVIGSVVPEAHSLRVSNAAGLAAGVTLQVDVDHPDAAEVLAVAGFTPVGVVSEPADVQFVFGFALDHRDGVAVHHVTTPIVLTAKALDTDGLSGDPVVFVADVAFGGVPSAARVGAGATAEYQAVSLFKATADADGYFEFPPITRIAKVRIAATVPPHPPLQIDLQLDYGTVEQWVAVNVA